MKNAREICFCALMRMEWDSGYSNLVLNSVLDKSELSVGEKSLATRMFYGCIEKKNILDYNIKQLLNRPNLKLDGEILLVLRIGMYQLLFMDSVADNVAVNETVKLCDFTRKSSAKGFVNAVLRSKIRQGKKICQPEENEKDALSVILCADKSVVSVFEKQYGREKAKSIFSAYESNKNVFIRVNTVKISTEQLKSELAVLGADPEPDERTQGCLVFKNPFNLFATEQFKSGFFFFQDISSQLCAKALEVSENMRILDACAAPGSKSFSVALNSGCRAKIVSCDVSENRVRLIREGISRLSLKNIETTVCDASKYNEQMGLFDRVLCDVPCTGLGVIAKKPEIRYKNIEPDALFSLQLTILENCSRYLKEDGVLVYSTCTLNKRENEDVIKSFLAKHSDFEPHPLSILKSGEFCKTFLPDEDGCDGFFICSLKKKEYIE